jgi:hypothetical protein
MKRLAIILLTLCLTVALVTSPLCFATDSNRATTDVDEAMAWCAARALLPTLADYAPGSTIDDIVAIGDETETLLYVVTVAPTGYLLIGANTHLPALLAYSATHDPWCPQDQENTLVSFATHDMRHRLSYLSSIPTTILMKRAERWDTLLSGRPLEQPDVRQWPPRGSTATGGWLETAWSQTAPYNAFCPIDNATKQRSLAGCPSVAMAQILNYHETTNVVAFNDSDDYLHNYAGNRYWIDNDCVAYDFPSFPTLNVHLSNLTGHYQQQVQPTTDDIAALIFACGVAAKQVYHPQGSGTFGVAQALDAYQRFGFINATLLTDDLPATYAAIQGNIQRGLPSHLAVVTEEWDSGHNLVIDGYNTDGYYHLNFGWGGSYDGWYLLPEELPYDLTVLEGVIVDIIDEYDGSDLVIDGALNWDDVRREATLYGEFTLQNIGDPGVPLSWEVVDLPEWGTWTITPSSGELSPEDGPITINVTVVAPPKRNSHFAGHLAIINPDDASDYCLVHISLTTPTALGRLLSQFPLLAFLLRALGFHDGMFMS